MSGKIGKHIATTNHRFQQERWENCQLWMWMGFLLSAVWRGPHAYGWATCVCIKSQRPVFCDFKEWILFNLKTKISGGSMLNEGLSTDTSLTPVKSHWSTHLFHQARTSLMKKSTLQKDHRAESAYNSFLQAFRSKFMKWTRYEKSHGTFPLGKIYNIRLYVVRWF